MDDYLDSCRSKKEAVSRILQAIEINAHTSWKIHGRESNALFGLKDIEVKFNSLSL